MTSKDLIIKYLTDAVDKLKTDSSEIDEEQMLKIAKTIAHVPMNKERACKYLNMSRAKFDLLVVAGKIPKGRKEVGSTSLKWYQDELDECKFRK